MLSKSGAFQEAGVGVTHLEKRGIEAVGVSSSAKNRGYVNAKRLVENREDRTDLFVFYDTFRPMQFFFLNWLMTQNCLLLEEIKFCN